MKTIDTLRRRRSAKTLTDPAPDEGALELLLECASRAPDHGRLRPWRFIVIRDAARERLGELLAEQLRRKQPAATRRDPAARAAKGAARAAHHSGCGRLQRCGQDSCRSSRSSRRAPRQQNMMLAATSLGFGAMWKTGDAAYDDAVKAALGLESPDAIVGFIYIGTAPSRCHTTARACRVAGPGELLGRSPLVRA